MREEHFENDLNTKRGVLKEKKQEGHLKEPLANWKKDFSF